MSDVTKPQRRRVQMAMLDLRVRVKREEAIHRTAWCELRVVVEAQRENRTVISRKPLGGVAAHRLHERTG